MKMMGIRYHHLWGATDLTLSMMSPDRYGARTARLVRVIFLFWCPRADLQLKNGQPASIDVDDLAVHIAQCRGRQVYRRADELLRPAPALRRIAALDTGIEGRVLDKRLVHVGQDVAGTDRVRLNVRRRPLGAHRAGEHLDATFGRRVGANRRAPGFARERADIDDLAAR